MRIRELLQLHLSLLAKERDRREADLEAWMWQVGFAGKRPGPKAGEVLRVRS